MGLEDTRLIDVAILIFDDMEILDAAGPISVFNAAKIPGDPKNIDPSDKFSEFYNKISLFNTKLITIYPREHVKCSDGTIIVPDYTLEQLQSGSLDFNPVVLVIPGGKGIQTVRRDIKFTNWLSEYVDNINLTLSVCTGAYALAEAGLLDSEELITTHWAHYGFFQEEFPNLKLANNVKYVDNGTNIITAGGVSSGIDGALRVIARIVSEEIAERVADRLVYSWLG